MRQLGRWLLPFLLFPAAAHAQRPTPRVSPAAKMDTVAPDSVPQPKSAAQAAADSLVRALLALPGYTATQYDAQSAVYRTKEGVLRLRGEAQVDRQGNQLTADTIIYRQQGELVEARGNPKVQGEQQELEGRVLYYDLAHHRATVLGARTQVQQTATWYITGENVTAEDRSEALYAQHGSFTTCNLDIPHYHFEAGKVKVVKDKYLVARPALLYFGKVPVFVLPFVVQSLERGRRSGLIVPKFSLVDIVRTSRNHVRQIDNLGYYWAINDYLGAQVGLTWRSGAYTALLGDVDYKWTRQFLSGRFALQQYWRTNSSTTFQLNTSNSWQPDERTRLSVSGNYAQSAAFVRQTTVDPMEQTQNLSSNLSLNRRFDWGTVALGSTIRQSIANGSLDMELPSFTISPEPITLFRAPSVEGARWYNNSTLRWSLNGARTLQTNQPGRQDQSASNVRGTQSLNVGNLSLSFSEALNTQTFHELFLPRDTLHGIERDTLLAGRSFDKANWNASLSYQQHLIGQTILSPSVSVSQDLVRNTAVSRSSVLANPDRFRDYVAGPMRLSVGAGLATTLFGFYPGVGPFSRIRHRLSPTLSYSYSPAVNQTVEQRVVFGELGGLALNTVTLSLNQTWEAKLKEPTPQKRAPSDTTAVDSLAQKSVPAEPEKVTLLSINTSAVTYDFERAAHGRSGFRTTTLSNTFTSDYLHGLSVQMTHELFDASDIDPQLPGNAGKLGRFSPRLTSLSTGFELGPDSWLARFLHLGSLSREDTVAQGVQPGPSPEAPGLRSGRGGFTNNPQGTGHGPWSASIRYSFTRQPRRFISNAVVGTYPETTIIDPTTGLPIPISDGNGFYVPSTAGADGRAIQTLSGNLSFALTPNWGVQWRTEYSITDNRFSRQVLNFQRSLHRWQANFSYALNPNGNSQFSFYVQLIDNQDLKAEYNQDYRAIDQRF